MKKIVLIIFLLASASLVRAQTAVLNESQTIKSDALSQFKGDENRYVAQTFTSVDGGPLIKVSMAVGYNSNEILTLFNVDSQGKPILSTALAVTEAVLNSQESGIHDYNFSVPYTLIKGKKYALQLSKESGFTQFGSVSGSHNNPYSNGEFFTVTNGVIQAIPSDDAYFKIYTYKLTTSITAPTCKYTATGTASANIYFGTAPYTYLWSNGATTETATGLAAGAYTVTVKDANNVSYMASATLTDPIETPLVFGATVETYVGASCNNKGILVAKDALPVQLLPTTYDNTKISLGNDATVSSTNGEYTLTPDQNDKKGYLLFNSITTQPKVFTAKFSLKGDNKSGADGFSFNYGEINTASTDGYENGILVKDASNNQKGLVLKFLTYNNDRIQLFYNGVKIGSDVITAIEDGNYHNYEVTMELSFGTYKLTVKKDNIALITGAIVADYGDFNPTANYRVAIAARTGGSNNNYRVKFNPTFTDNTPYEYSLNNLDYSAYAYLQDIPAGQQKLFVRLPGMACGKLIGTYTVAGTSPPAAPTVTSPQTFAGGTKVSGITLPASPTDFYIRITSDAAGQIGIAANTLLTSKTYYARYQSTDNQCQGLISPIVVNVDNIPTIDKIATVDVCSSNTADVAVKLTDENVNALTLTTVSSDTNILPNSGLTISGNGANRIVKITPTINVSGIVTVTLTTKDVNNTTVSNFVVRIVNESTLAGVKIFAGNGNASVVADNVLPTATHLVSPKYVDTDKTGNVFIGEAQKVRRIDKANGKITTIATTSGTTEIKGVTVDNAGNVFYTDGAIIYKLTAGAGSAVKYAGSATGTQVTDNTGVANANIGEIQFMYIDNFDNMYVITDGGARIRLILPDVNKTLRDAAGTGVAGYDDDGALATSTKLSGITGLTKDATGNIYFTLSTTVDYGRRNAVRKVAESGKRISTVFSSYPQQTGPTQQSYSYPVSSAFTNCKGIDIGADNSLYVAQEYNIVQIFGSNYENSQPVMGSAREIPDNSPYGFMGVAYDSSTDLLLLPAYQTSGSSIEQSNRVYRYVPSIFVTCNTTLPVTLTTFTAKAEGNKSKIEWTTSSEQNNNRFEVQRSSDGINFITISTVKANGESNGTKRYSAYDAQPVIGINYYRLKQIDDNGKETITSAVKSVSFNFEDNVSAKLFPNPADDVVNISVLNYKGMQLNVNVIDVNGKVVHQEVIDTKTNALSYKLNLGKKLIPGYYSVKLSGLNYNTVLKLIVH